MPKVSVILTSYNQDKYLAASIESVLNQTFTDFELLICDDGSTDDSQKIIKTFDDERIKLFLYEKNRGAYFAVTEAFNSMEGKYFALQHSDDIWENTKLEKQVKFMDENPQYEVCFTQVKFIDERGEIYNLPENHHYKNVFKQKNRSREEWLHHLFWNGNCFCHPSILSIKYPQYFISNPILFQLPDYFTWIKFLQQKNIYVIEEELTLFRIRREVQNSVSSWSAEKLVRVNNEAYFTAKEFLPILRDEKFFLKVFPEAQEFLIDGKISTEFAFAQFCLKRKIPAFQKLALEILYDLLHNDTKCNFIKKYYGYSEKNFINDTASFDVFGIKTQLPILNCKLYFEFGEGFTEKNSILNPVLVQSDGYFVANFDFHTDRKIETLRFDPDDKAALSVKILKIQVNGEIVENFNSNAFQVVDDYYNFLTADPFFIIDKKISTEKIHIEIFGAVKNDPWQNFEKKYSETCATIQQLENLLQQKNSQIQQLENSLQQKNLQVQQLENSLQQKNSQIQQLENSISAQNQDISLKTQQIKSQAEEIHKLQTLNTEILNSNSWKITKPLRYIGKMLRKI